MEVNEGEMGVLERQASENT